MNRLGELERAIMEILWQTPEPMTVRQVGNCLTDRDLAHTTVMTVLDRLAKKGFVRRQRSGRAWRYRPAESREAYVAELMLTALDQTADRHAALARFAHSVSDAEAASLRTALEALGASDIANDGQAAAPPPSALRSANDGQAAAPPPSALRNANDGQAAARPHSASQSASVGQAAARPHSASQSASVGQAAARPLGGGDGS